MLFEHFESSLVACAGYCNLLIKSAISFDLKMEQVVKLIDAVKNAKNVDSSVIMNLSKYLEKEGNKEIAVELLKKSLESSKDTILQA